MSTSSDLSFGAKYIALSSLVDGCGIAALTDQFSIGMIVYTFAYRYWELGIAPSDRSHTLLVS